MARDLVTLRLNGDVPLDLYVRAIRGFLDLIDALSLEVARTNEIEWSIADLDAGSAYAAVRGIYYDIDSVERVVEAYRTIGTAISTDRPIPYSETIALHTSRITSVLNSRIRSIGLGIEDEEIVVDKPFRIEEEEERKVYSLGTIKGIAGTITNRPSLKLTVFDTLFDRAVFCFLENDMREDVRGAWDKQVEVTGMIFRDPDTGRPVEVRGVSQVSVIDDLGSFSFEELRGVLYDEEDQEPAEVTIRRLRDA